MTTRNNNEQIDKRLDSGENNNGCGHQDHNNNTSNGNRLNVLVTHANCQ